MPDFLCAGCGRTFTLSAEVIARYPGWTPRQCMNCKTSRGSKPAGPAAAPVRTDAAREGLFTDGACSGNPGPGGWGVVWVRNGEIVAQASGGEQRTTNNRMELSALIEAYRMLPEDSTETVWSDSTLCVRTVNEWAAGWERRGWKRKTGPVENLDLVKSLYELAKAHPRVSLRWLKGHAGQRWNEHADQLATAYQRALTKVVSGEEQKIVVVRHHSM